MVQTTINDKILADRSGPNRSSGKPTTTEHEARDIPPKQPAAPPSSTSIDAGSARLLQQSNDSASVLRVEDNKQAVRLLAELQNTFEQSPELAAKAHSGVTGAMTEAALSTISS